MTSPRSHGQLVTDTSHLAPHPMFFPLSALPPGCQPHMFVKCLMNQALLMEESTVPPWLGVLEADPSS